MKPIVVLGWVLLLLSLNTCSDTSTDSSSNDRRQPVIRVPDDAPTIRAALEVARDGDTILVADGVYQDDGNRDLSMPDLSVVIRSVNGPAATIIDGQGEPDSLHYIFAFDDLRSSVVIDGLTFRGAYDNHGAVRCKSASPTFVNCVFVDNHATISGGALRCKSASPTLRNCTITGNSSAGVGGGLFLIAGSSPALENCIISHSEDGGAIYASENTSIPTLTCCNLNGNVGGDWVDRIADQAETNGNFSEDPLFCDLDTRDLNLQEASPCAPDNNDCGQLIGAGEVGCP